MERLGPVEIADGVYWVGGEKQERGLVCNPYLIVDGEEAVIIDPGSVLDFDEVFSKVTEVVPLDRVKYCVLHHQDPDFCSSVPLFEKKGAGFQVVTHWRAQTLIQFYGIKSPYYIVNQHGFQLTLASGRILRFLPTPYLHFPGAIVTYDEKTKVLFSSDLFGAFSGVEWSLFAGDDYLEKMLAFHEHYMPSNDILRPVMEGFLRLDISVIAPQHGSIIRDNIAHYIRALRDLECGAFLAPLKKDLAASGGFRTVCTLVLRRYAAVFGKQEVLDLIEGLDLVIDGDRLEIIDYSYTGDRLWELLFETVLARKGIQWLAVIEPYVTKLSREYDIPLPGVFKSTIKEAEEKVFNLNREIVYLQQVNERLKETVQNVQETLTRCPVTGLYNYQFFWQYLKTETEGVLRTAPDRNPSLVVIEIDNIEDIRLKYGEEEVNAVLKNVAGVLKALKDDYTVVFRLEGAGFACYVPHLARDGVLELAEKIRNGVAESRASIEEVTVSVGVASLQEIMDKEEITGAAEGLYRLAYARAKMARDSGGNRVVSLSDVADVFEDRGKVLVVESDEVSIDVLKAALYQRQYTVLVARDGDEALVLAKKELPGVIISEIMLPKMDGFLLRQSLLARSETKEIPFVIVSHLKTEDTVKRAAGLGIEHYLQKPVIIPELLGIVDNNIRKDAGR